jgi:hypothetical protein
MDKQDFSGFLEAVRKGDHKAAADLVKCFEPYIRSVIRLRIRDQGLRRVLDSLDICQSIMAQFFDKAAQGRFTELETEAHLRKLLVAMARNKVID